MADDNTNALLTEMRDLMKQSIQRQDDHRAWYEKRAERSYQEQQALIDVYKKTIWTNTLLVGAVIVGVLIATVAAAHR